MTTPAKTLDERIDTLKKAREAATQGEWKIEAYEDSYGSPRCRIYANEPPPFDNHPKDIIGTEGIGGQFADACDDTDFITLAANEAIPIIEKLQHREKVLREHLGHVMALINDKATENWVPEVIMHSDYTAALKALTEQAND